MLTAIFQVNLGKLVALLGVAEQASWSAIRYYSLYHTH